MPFLRFSRDKRGYESTYLCHTFRRGGKPQLRVLYWFRTPADVKVGRLALDPVAIRLIEESNPDLQFDWAKILKVKPPPPPTEYGREERRARRRRGRDTGEAGDPQASDATVATGQIATPEPAVTVESETERSGPDSAIDTSVPAIMGWDDLDPGDEPAGATESGPTHVVLRVTDEQGLARLRARHAEIQARINERVREPATLEQLQAQAALLDPDAWRTVEEVRERLASLDAATVAIRKVLGRRRRTRRGGARRRRRREGHGGEMTMGSDNDLADAPTAASPAAPAQPGAEDIETRDE